jgi:hypothetical protein
MPGLNDLISTTNLSGMMNSILTLPNNNNLKKLPIYPLQEEEHNYVISEEEGSNIYSNLKLKIGGKSKKKVSNKKQIDTYTKDKLVKIAKKHDIKLSSKGVKHTKQQLFNSLKRKKLI